jgi:hypothetical protein
MNRSTWIAFAAVLAVSGDTAIAHPGGLDKNGGHTNRKTGEYHLHGGPSVPEARTAPRTEARTTPRTSARSLAGLSDAREEQAPEAPQVLSIDDQLQQAREHIANARSILRNLVDNSPGTPAADEAQKLLTQHRLDEPAGVNALQKNERAAASKLTLAKNALREKQPASARRWLNEVLEEYPDTDAAKEAADLLKRVAR